MNKEQVWHKIVKQTRLMERGELRLTPKGARQFFDLVWRKAQDDIHSVTNGYDLPDFLRGLYR